MAAAKQSLEAIELHMRILSTYREGAPSRDAAGRTHSRMRFKPFMFFVVLSVFLFAGHSRAAEKSNVIWMEPTDITSRNLLYGPGGAEHAPHGLMTFLKEDREGANPKFDLQDSGGTKWKAKLGAEARPETVAAHLLWAVGYFADEDYFVANLQVDNMPAHLKRGQELIKAEGSLENGF